MKHFKRVLSGPTAGDIALVSGRAVIEESREQTAVCFASRLRFFRGAWFADIDEGLPYFDVFFGKNRDTAVIRAMFVDALESHPEARGVTFCDVEITNRKQRVCTVNFEVATTLGSVGPAAPLYVGV